MFIKEDQDQLKLIFGVNNHFLQQGSDGGPIPEPANMSASSRTQVTEIIDKLFTMEDLEQFSSLFMNKIIPDASVKAQNKYYVSPADQAFVKDVFANRLCKIIEAIDVDRQDNPFVKIRQILSLISTYPPNRTIHNEIYELAGKAIKNLKNQRAELKDFYKYMIPEAQPTQVKSFFEADEQAMKVVTDPTTPSALKRIALSSLGVIYKLFTREDAKAVEKELADLRKQTNALQNSNDGTRVHSMVIDALSKIMDLVHETTNNLVLSTTFDIDVSQLLKKFIDLRENIKNSIKDDSKAQKLLTPFYENVETWLKWLTNLQRGTEIKSSDFIDWQVRLNINYERLKEDISKLSPPSNFTKLKDALRNMSISLPSLRKSSGNSSHVELNFAQLIDDEDLNSLPHAVIFKGLTKKYNLENDGERAEFAKDLMELCRNVLGSIKDSVNDVDAVATAKSLLGKAKQFDTWVKNHATLLKHDGSLETYKKLYSSIKDMHLQLNISIGKPKLFKKLVEKYDQAFGQMKESIGNFHTSVKEKNRKISKYFKAKFRKSLLNKYKSLFRVKRFDKFIDSKEVQSILDTHHLEYEKTYQGKTSGLGFRQELGKIKEISGDTSRTLVTFSGGNFNFVPRSGQLTEVQEQLFEVFLKRIASKKNPPPMNVTGCVLQSLCKILNAYMNKHNGKKTIAVDIHFSDDDIKHLPLKQRETLIQHQGLIGKDVNKYQQGEAITSSSPIQFSRPANPLAVPRSEIKKKLPPKER